MTTAVYKLVISVVDDLFGPICAKTISTLVSHHRVNMRDLINLSGFDRRTVNQALCVLIGHNFVNFDEPVIDGKRKPVVYSVNIRNCVVMVMFPIFVHVVKSLHGDIAEIILEEVLHQGCTTRDKVLETCRMRIKASNSSKIDADTMENMFDVLVSRNYLEKTEDPDMDDDGKERSAKRFKGDDSRVLWRVNSNTFLNYLRDQEIVKFVRSKFDEASAEIVSIILTLNTQAPGDLTQMSSSISYDQILQNLKAKKPNLVPFAQGYLDILVDSPLGIVKVVRDYNNSYYINFTSFYEEYTRAHVASIVKERFGPKCQRVFSIVLSKNMIEQKQVAELAMLPFKDAKELLYKLYSEGFLKLQELHQTPDLCPARTFYLFNAPMEQIRMKLLDVCFKAAHNLMAIRKDKLNENARLVDKSLRADAAIVQAQQSGLSADDLEDMLTSSEKQQLGVCMRIVKRLDLGEITLVDSICALSHFGAANVA